MCGFVCGRDPDERHLRGLEEETVCGHRNGVRSFSVDFR